jgi:hypothetical protein
MKATRAIQIDVQMTGTEAAKLERTLGRVMEQLDKLPKGNYERLVNLGDVDTLLSFRTTLASELEGL